MSEFLASEDVTRRLRMSASPESVDRERYMAATLFGDAMREQDGRIISHEQMRRLSRQSIEAACVFWEEWDITVLTPDMAVVGTEEVFGWCIGEMK